jgi:hypothetical protein
MLKDFMYTSGPDTVIQPCKAETRTMKWGCQERDPPSDFHDSILWADGYISRHFSQEKSSDPVPGYREILAAGGILPITPYVVTKRTASGIPSKFTEECYNEVWPVSRVSKGDAHWVNELKVLSGSQVHDRRDEMLQAAAADAFSEGWQALVDLAESPKTVKMLWSAVTAFRDRRQYILKKLLRKGKRPGRTKRQARLFVQEFYNTWMEARYGWRPMMYSANDAYQAIQSYLEPEKIRVKVRKTAPTVVNHTPSYWARWGNSTGAGTGPSQSEAIHTTTVKDRGFFLGDVERSAAQGVDLNPLGTVYEIIPYSFVWDWFFNTADVLNAHFRRSHFTQSVMGTSRHIRDEFSLEFSSWNAGTADSYGGKFAAKAEHYERAPATSIPWDHSFRPRVSPQKVVDIMAMLSGLKDVSKMRL